MRKILSILAILLAMLLVWLWMDNRAPEGPQPQHPTVSNGASPNAPSPTPSFAPLHFSSAHPVPTVTHIGSANAPSPFRVISCTPEETILEFTLPEYNVTPLEDTEGVTWQLISIDGADSLDIAGKPSLPSYHLAYGAAPGSTLTIEVLNQETALLPDCRPLPARGPYLRTQEPPEIIPSEEVYAPQAGIYPAQNAYIASSYQIRGIQGNGILFSPFQYDANTNAVRVVTRCEISLRSDSATPAILSSQSDFAQLQLTQFVNSDSFRGEAAPIVGNLSILVPDAWKDSEILKEFVTWKESVGWTVDMTAYPSETGEGRDKILAWSQEQYAEGMTHLLLLGDYSFIPPWQHGSKMTKGSPVYTGVATDTPYALLEGEYDKGYMDVFLGRIPAPTLDFLENVLQNSMYYEHGAYQNNTWTQKGVYIGSSDKSKYWPYQGKADTAIIQEQASALDSAGIIQRDLSTELYAANNPTAANVSTALNAGASILLYLGHGNCTRFTTTTFASANAKALNNQGMLPFIMAPVCYTGNLDHYSASDFTGCGSTTHSVHSLGQTFFENSNSLGGVVGAALSSQETYWNPPIRQIETFTTDLTNNRSTTRLTTQGAYELHSLNAAVTFCINYLDDYRAAGSPGGKGSYDAATGVLHAWEMALYGDPTAVLHVGPQVPLNIAYSLQTDGSANITITGFDAESPRPVPNCAIAIETEGGIISGRTNSDGIFTLQDGSAILLGASARVLDGSGPYLEKKITVDLDADSDGKITNREMSQWLEFWQACYNPENENAPQMLAVRDRAIAEWQEKTDAPKCAENASQESLESLAPLASLASLDICDYLDTLCHDYWPYIRPTTIGTSVNGTPISGVRISLAEEDAAVPNLLLLSEVHGDEPEAVKQLKEVLDTLVKGVTGKDPGARQWLENCVIWVLPVFNPDGYALGTATNVHGVDLGDGFPTNCGTLANGDPTQLYIPWNFKDAQRLPEIEQKSFVRWMIAHSVSSVMELRQGDRYVSYSGEQSETLAYFLADFAGYACDASKAGSLLDWLADYMECQVYAVSAPESEDDAYTAVTNWIANANLATATPAVQRVYLPGYGKEIGVSLTDAGKTPVIRLLLPSGWQAKGCSADCLGMRQGNGYADIAFTSDTTIDSANICITADTSTERETCLDFIMDTPTAQTSWKRVMVAPTYQEKTTISLRESWQPLVLSLQGITPENLGVSEAYSWKDGAFVKCDSDCFLPGVGYWVKAKQKNTIILSGWREDPPTLNLKKGIHFLGTTFTHKLDDNDTLYEEKDGVFQILPPAEDMPANRALWRYIPKDTILVP